MTSDLQLIEGMYGAVGATFVILDEEGNEDDLTAYDSISMLIAQSDYSSNVYTAIDTDPEIDTSLFSTGRVIWTPSAAKPVPAAGYYWITVYRNSTLVSKPIRKFFLEVTPRVTA